MSARPMRLEIYKSERACRAKHEVQAYCSPVDQWRWRIRATNGRILADSGEAYVRLRDCAHGAGLVTGIWLAGLRAGDDETYLIEVESRVSEALSGRRFQSWRITVEK